MDISTDLTLAQRKRLPEALRVLLDEIPRNAWPTHNNFGGMVEFWLQRHLMFRELLERLETETQDSLDNKIDAQGYGARLSRLGGFFLQQLHGHHQIEDTHYFPQLTKLDTRLVRGFDILDADHHALDGLLNDFATGANAVLQAPEKTARDATGAFGAQLVTFKGFLNRHLLDEEDLIVPVILKTGFDG